MLSTQRSLALHSRPLPLDLELSGRGPLENGTQNSTGASTNRSDPSSRLRLTTSISTTFLESPSTLSANERFSRLAIAKPDQGDAETGLVRYERYLSQSPKEDEQRSGEFRGSESEGVDYNMSMWTPTPSTSSRTLSFAVMSSPDPDGSGDDLLLKVEEIEDDELFVAGSVKQLSSEHAIAVEPPCQPARIPITNAPRKRGRPRKHPLPPPGQVKITKGRSKTGCITCRRRKKKCDETKPTCLNCHKNAVVCEGYPAREIWKSGKQKMEEAQRRNSLTAVPRSLPILIDGVETEIDRRFLDHFVYNFSRVLTLINDDSNPFKEILLPMATQHRGLMHSLMCLSGSHLSARDPEPLLKERKHYHFDRAISDLRLTIQARSESSTEPELLVDDPTIASTIALCLNTICEGETTGEYRTHMDAARYLLITKRPKNEKFKQFIVEFFQYHDVSSSLTTLDRRPICLTGDLRLPDFVPGAQAGALLGIFDGLFHYISEITVIRDRIRQRAKEGLEPRVDYQTLSDAVAIDSSIRSWEPPYTRDNPNWCAAQLYRQSTWVYLYRTIRPSRLDEKISQVVDDGLQYLDQLPTHAGAYGVLLMPLFLLGCSAFEVRQRDRILKGFDCLNSYSNLRNIAPALEIVKQVWEKMDIEPEKSWDWESIIEDMHMDFLIT